MHCHAVSPHYKDMRQAGGGGDLLLLGPGHDLSVYEGEDYVG